ncbi:MAG: N-acetylmuramoyl-L-alanine amidase [Deltaproteobacteria bacterium]|nr:MAG: N-acetylmuramoyl-L-alanine amidase [Deltaproteobacteria bacterium]
MNILIDPGHGGFDPGACSNGLREADYVLAVGRYLMTYLQTLGHEAHLTRSSDHALGLSKAADLEERCKMERSWRPALFLSIHCNAASNELARGFEIWTSPGQTRSDVAAESLVEAFAAAFPQRLIRRDLADGDSDKESRFRVLTGTVGPAVLVELGFVTHAEEAQWLRDNQIAIVRALAAGIEGYARTQEAA